MHYPLYFLRNESEQGCQLFTKAKCTCALTRFDPQLNSVHMQSEHMRSWNTYTELENSVTKRNEIWFIVAGPVIRMHKHNTNPGAVSFV